MDCEGVDVTQAVEDNYTDEAAGSDVLNLANAVFCTAQTHPSAIALVVDDKPYTYEELADAAARIATWVSRNARKRAEGKSTKDAIRCLKRHLTRRIWHLLQTPAPIPDQTRTPTTSLT